jgi:hypothetical protein
MNVQVAVLVEAAEVTGAVPAVDEVHGLLDRSTEVAGCHGR